MTEPEDWADHDVSLDNLKERLGDQSSDDLAAWMSPGPGPSTMFHYTDLSGALAILQSGHLWFTERAHLNDTQEVQYAFRVCQKLFAEAAQRRGSNLPPFVADHLKGEFEVYLDQYGY